VTDSDKDDAATAPTLGISRSFDSLEATQRLAAQTGMAGEFSDYAATLRIPTSGATAATPAVVAVRSGPKPRRVSVPPVPPGPHRYAWGRREWWILALGLAMSIVIAAAIAFG
jgi:hypothetical protein